MFRPAMSLMVLGLLFLHGSSARGQAAVPGGWGAQFGYQSFTGPGYGGYGGSYGFGPYVGPAAVYPGPFATGGAALYPPIPPAMTANAMGPLMQAIRQSPSRRRSGW